MDAGIFDDPILIDQQNSFVFSVFIYSQRISIC